MKPAIVIASSLLLCSCADMYVTKTDVATPGGRTAGAIDAKDVHVVFNNNNLDYAPRAAIRLRAALGQSVALPSPQTPELF